MIRALPVPAPAVPPFTPVERPAALVRGVLPAAAFALLCLWSRSSPGSMVRQLNPDVFPL
jgi:hypothetical protein